MADADWSAQMRNTETEVLFARKVSRPFAGIVTNVDLENEVRAIKRLCKTGHLNIVQVFEYGKLKLDGMFFYIDMELCKASLEGYLRGGVEVDGFAWKQICKDDVTMVQTSYTILQHIVNGLFYIHAMGEVHRDLSPHNGIVPFDSSSVLRF
jgi:serine/threonine protein kinase